MGNFSIIYNNLFTNPLAHLNFQILVKAEDGLIFRGQLSCLFLRMIFAESKAYLSRPRDSGFSLVALYFCTTCHCLSERCHSRCSRPAAGSEPWCCSGSHSRPCRSLEGKKKPGVSIKEIHCFLLSALRGGFPYTYYTNALLPTCPGECQGR